VSSEEFLGWSASAFDSDRLEIVRRDLNWYSWRRSMFKVPMSTDRYGSTAQCVAHVNSDTYRGQQEQAIFLLMNFGGCMKQAGQAVKQTKNILYSNTKFRSTSPHSRASE
jgi:hypothetical protein